MEGRGWIERVLALNADAPANVLSKALLGAGILAWVEGDYGHAQMRLGQALARLHDANEPNLFGRTLLALGRLAWDQDLPDLAQTRFEEAHLLFRDGANRFGTANCLHGLGLVAQSQGDLQRATALLEEALDVWRSLGLSWGLACCIPGHLGDVARAQDPARGIQEALGIECAPAEPTGHSGVRHGLTPRELQVLRLLAGGASNQGIAETLFISIPTVKAHVTSILAKLALDSRTAAAYYAHTHDLT